MGKIRFTAVQLMIKNEKEKKLRNSSSVIMGRTNYRTLLKYDS